ncbi:hypothetical protein NQZ68_020996 [Dissostichus eleginoides]|nr:hypothetical protein NQZ68_020996 [Dissostichus eleginoides]
MAPRQRVCHSVASARLISRLMSPREEKDVPLLPATMMEEEFILYLLLNVLNGVGLINHCHPHMGTAKPPEREARAGARRRTRLPASSEEQLTHYTSEGVAGYVPPGRPSRCAQWLLGDRLLGDRLPRQRLMHETEHHIKAGASLGRPATGDGEAGPITTIKRKMINN